MPCVYLHFNSSVDTDNCSAQLHNHLAVCLLTIWGKWCRIIKLFWPWEVTEALQRLDKWGFQSAVCVPRQLPIVAYNVW